MAAARARAGARMHAELLSEGPGGANGGMEGEGPGICGRAAVGCGMQGGKSASAPMPSGLPRVARA